jgi:hypothetical protein
MEYVLSHGPTVAPRSTLSGMEDELASTPQSHTLTERGPADWFLLIRRWSGVPDVVGDEIAVTAVCDRLLAMIDPELKEKYPRTHFRGDALLAIGGVVKRGNAGELDWFLMGLTAGPQGIEGLIEDAAKFCLEDRNPSEFRLAVTIELLGHLREYIDGHKFQANCGSYFN